MTIILIVITAFISIICFGNRNLFEKLQFNPYRVYHNKEYYRLITHAFVHADWIHLFVNMFVLYSFGRALEFFLALHGNSLHFSPVVIYLALYLSSTIVSSLTTLKKYRDVFNYNAVGASGAVASVLFACIFFDPWMKLGLYLVIPVPGIIFGVLYLWYSNYMSKKSGDNINHDAHFLGAIYGITFPVLLNPELFYEFIKLLTNPHFSL
jgi:membrane associated rhomboid family serine protease